jgi:hypothetical protein
MPGSPSFLKMRFPAKVKRIIKAISTIFSCPCLRSGI